MKKFITDLNLAGVNKGAIIRLIVGILVLVNYVLTATGHTPIQADENVLAGVVIIIVTILSFVQSYWKNNSWTKAAQDADKRYEELKRGK